LQVGHALGSISVFAATALGLCVLFYGVAWFQQSRALGDWLEKQGGALWGILFYLTSRRRIMKQIESARASTQT